MRELIVLHITSMLFLLVSCAPISSQTVGPATPTPLPQVSWDANPEVRIMLANYCCDSPTTKELVRFYVPEAQLWGDSRFLWTEQDDNGIRQVFVKQMAADEMAVLLQEIGSSGFFDWDEQYKSEPVVDAASQCLAVTLTDQNKTVCATHGGAPDSFYALFSWLAEGAGTSGALYWPKRAYLTGFRLEDTGILQPQPDVTWPETLADIPIAEAINGFWLDDEETLRLFWEAANHNPYHMPVVEDSDGRYRLILQIPGVSWIEP